MPHGDQAPRDNQAATAPAARHTPAGDYPLEVSHAQMNTAYDDGEAVPFAQAVSWLIRYDGSWWVVYERGWLRVTDEPTATDLDQRSAQITAAEAQQGRDAAIRAAVASQPGTSATNTITKEQP